MKPAECPDCGQVAELHQLPADNPAVCADCYRRAWRASSHNVNSALCVQNLTSIEWLTTPIGRET